MHIKEVILSILDDGHRSDRFFNELLVMVMVREPKRPISYNHFSDCLRLLEEAEQITIDGTKVHRVIAPATA